MDKRPKVLIVEDDPGFREGLVEVLEDEGCRVQACTTLAEARTAIHEMTFDLALVDIMLRGPADMSDRGGLQVLSMLKEVNEGTRVIVVSGQRHDLELVRDILKEYGADDYILKQNIGNTGGLDYLLDILRPSLKLSMRAPAYSWNTLIRVLAHDSDEESFVHNALTRLDFKGGQPVLHDALMAAAKWLVPVFPSTEQSSAGGTLPGGIVGVYWSKGQGSAVEIVVHGSNVDRAALDKQISSSKCSEMYRRTKGGLTVGVYSRPDLRRSRFANG